MNTGTMHDDDPWDTIPSPPMHYDRSGTPITMREWVELQERPGYRRVASTRVGRWWISTVWTGLNLNWWPGGRPLVFETMVFRDDGPAIDEMTERYPCEETALVGHVDVVEAITVMEKTGLGGA